MDMSRRGFVCAVAFGLALVLGATGWVEAQSTLEIVKKRGKLIAGVKTDFPPFGTIDAAGKNVGFDVDVAHRFAKALFNDENRSEEHTSELQSRLHLVCRLLLEKKKTT